jgi:hypothetical protein
VEKANQFEGPSGEASLLDLFEDRRQLILCRAVCEPGWPAGPIMPAKDCSFGADQVSHLAHLNARDTTLVWASRAPGRPGSPVSGGYAGAKRMQMLIANSCQKTSDRLEWAIRFPALAPAIIMPGTDFGRHAVEGYAEYLATSVADFTNRMNAPRLRKMLSQQYSSSLHIRALGRKASSRLTAMGAQGARRIRAAYGTPGQRAVLLLVDVLGWSSAETASLIGGSMASVNSALQRARATLARHTHADLVVPPDQQALLSFAPGKTRTSTASSPC